MSIVIPGGLIIATLLLTSVLLFGTSLNARAIQAQAFKEFADVNTERLGSAIDITSATASNLNNGTDVTVVVKNIGSGSIAIFDQMDVIMHYTTPPNVLVGTRLAYTTANPPGDNLWTKTGISPDSLNPGMWDPNETLTISLRVVPKIKDGTTGTLVIATPKGVTDSFPVLGVP